jgi:hypothetical protein
MISKRLYFSRVGPGSLAAEAAEPPWLPVATLHSSPSFLLKLLMSQSTCKRPLIISMLTHARSPRNLVNDKNCRHTGIVDWKRSSTALNRTQWLSTALNRTTPFN